MLVCFVRINIFDVARVSGPHTSSLPLYGNLARPRDEEERIGDFLRYLGVPFLALVDFLPVGVTSEGGFRALPLDWSSFIRPLGQTLVRTI